MDVLQAKKNCEKRSMRFNYPKKKKVPGWSFSKSSPVQQVAVTYPIRVSAASLGAVSWPNGEIDSVMRPKRPEQPAGKWGAPRIVWIR